MYRYHLLILFLSYNYYLLINNTGRKPTRPSLPLRKAFFYLSCKESSTFLTKPLFPQEREDVTALRCSEPLRYKVGGASKPSPYCAGWDRLGYTLIGKVCTFFELLQYSILFYLVLYLFLRTTCPAKNFLSYLFPLRQLRLSEICFPDVFPLIVIQ